MTYNKKDLEQTQLEHRKLDEKIREAIDDLLRTGQLILADYEMDYTPEDMLDDTLFLLRHTKEARETDKDLFEEFVYELVVEIFDSVTRYPTDDYTNRMTHLLDRW